MPLNIILPFLVPCSVITSHGEPQDSSPSNGNGLQETLCLQVFSSSKSNELSAHSNLIETNLVTPENNDSWRNNHPLQNSNQNSELSDRNHLSSRVRKLKRPYSPPLSEKKSSKNTSLGKTKNIGVDRDSQACEKPFMCERCSSPYVVNPARCHSSAKTYTPRKVFDPDTKKTLVVCNACRLSLARSQKAKTSRARKQSPPSEETKTDFQEECIKFSAALVEKLKDSDASRLYCPVFTIRPCKCLQNYLTSPDEEEQSLRAVNLLNLLKKAKQLSAQKNSLGLVQNPRPCGLLKCKSQMFEEFVQEMRVYLRSQLKLCERACQRVLMYSNNFLHKQLKSAPDKGARVQHLGRSSRQPLCPISKLPNENCCQERCVLMALTHSRLLEDWRTTARRSQRDARRVLAEMLTPSGGSKANCYKFIRMVTGCSQTTICLVSKQMWHTQGSREPPEHGLRRWWQKQAGLNSGEGRDIVGSESCAEGDDDLEYEEVEQVNEEQGRSKDLVLDEDPSGPSITDIHIPTARELRELAPAEAGRRLLQQRRKLASVQRQLVRQQRQLETLRQQRPPIILGCCSGITDLPQSVQQTAVVQQPTAVPSVAPQPQVVHILEIPATPTSVIPSVPEACQQHPTLSVVSSSGEFEPITNISVNVTPGQPLGTVFFVPEYEPVSTFPTDHTPQGSNVIFTSSATEADTIQLQQNLTTQSQVTAPIAPAAQLQLTSQAQPHTLHLPTMQVHLPLDIPVQLAVESSVQTEQSTVQVAVQHTVPSSGTDQPLSHPPSQSQPIILPSPQPIPFQVTQPPTSSNPAPHHVSLQNTPAAVLNKNNCSVQISEPQVYYLETVNCVSSVPD